MKIAIIIFMVLMTILVYASKYMPLQKIRPFIYKSFPEKYARLVFNTLGAILIAAFITYLVLSMIFLFNAPVEVLAAIVAFFFIREIIKMIKERKK